MRQIEPIPNKYHDMMNCLAEGLDQMLNGPLKQGAQRDVAFVVIIADAETDKASGAQVNYISNCKQPDMLLMLKEMIARIEGRYSAEVGRG